MDGRKREGLQLLLRFAQGSDLRERLEQVARQNNRSLTAEILNRLEQSLDDGSEAKSAAAVNNLLRLGVGDDLEKRVFALEQKLEGLQSKLGQSE